MKHEFSRQVFSNSQTSNIKKIRPLAGDSFFQYPRTRGRQRDRQNELIVSFRNITNAPKKWMLKHLSTISTQTDTIWPQLYIIRN